MQVSIDRFILLASTYLIVVCAESPASCGDNGNRCPGGIQCCLDLCKCNGYTSAHCRFYTTNEKICECSNDEFLTRQIPPKECKN